MDLVQFEANSSPSGLQPTLTWGCIHSLSCCSTYRHRQDLTFPHTERNWTCSRREDPAAAAFPKALSLLAKHQSSGEWELAWWSPSMSSYFLAARPPYHARSPCSQSIACLEGSMQDRRKVVNSIVRRAFGAFWWGLP
jgi:hypothetical protein